MKILVGTKSNVFTATAIVEDIAVTYFSGLGYEVGEIDGQRIVYGKKDGVTDYTSGTTAWAIPQPVDPENPDGEWFIPSPSDDPRFHLWRDYLPEGVDVQCEEVEHEI